MVVKELDDPGAFLEACAPFLVRDEARNNLLLGIASTLRDHPSLDDEYRLWIVEDGDQMIGVALRTPRTTSSLRAQHLPKLCKLLPRTSTPRASSFPGVTGAQPEVEHFAAVWEARARVARRGRMAQRIYRLTTLRQVEGVPGRARTATQHDRPLLLGWMRSFFAEAIPEGTPNLGPDQAVDARLGGGSGGFTVWEDGGPVSLAGWGGTTPNGVRNGPVYTPPEYRRRGYGSAVTAAVSAERLASGATFCFLYTDLANPTSNKIYTDLGYEPVCDSIDYAFEPG